jgi:chromate transporter
MALFAYGVEHFAGAASGGWLHGLKIAAVAVVANAVWGMAQSLAPDRERATIAVLATIIALTFPTAWGQIGAILFGALAGLIVLPRTTAPHGSDLVVPIGRAFALACLAVFFILLIGLPIVAAATHDHALELAASFYRSGSLVFGGGHVVLPLLQASVVPPGWISNDAFLAGYGAAQAVPGPLFTFAAYLGTVMGPQPNGWAGGLLCLAAIYLPSFLLLVGVLPFWDALRRRGAIRAALTGVNAVVVGLLLAALYTPVWTSAIHTPADFAIGIVAFLLLALWAVPPWLVVVLGALVASAAALIAPV